MKRHILAVVLVLLCAGIYFLNYGLEEILPITPTIEYVINKPVSEPTEIIDQVTEPVSESIDKTDDIPADPDATPPKLPKEGVNDYSKIVVVNDPRTFFYCLTEARDRLIPTINLKITNYNDTDYDIHKFERGKYSLSSSGKSIGKTAYMTYTFKFSDSYMISRACEDETLISALSDEQRQTMDKLYAVRDLLIKDGMSDYEKELAIHDYIVKNYQYDTYAAEQENISDDATSITFFLREHKGVCEAYSYTFKALCNLSGLRCHVVTGILDGVNHAWNIVGIDGSFYHIDVTSDDPVPDIPQHCFYSYFNLTDMEISKTHTMENKWYECHSDKYNYFKYNNYIVNNYTTLHSLTMARLSQGYNTIMFKTQGYTLTTDDINQLLYGKGFTSYTITGDMTDPNADHEITLQK